MANTITIITKHNNTSGSVPPALAEGELAINTHPSDLTLYVGTSAGGVASLNISGGIGGGVSSSYAVTSSYASHLSGFPQTGWMASSGSATRTPFDTTTVTTQNLAERVKALIDDLLASGLLSS